MGKFKKVDAFWVSPNGAIFPLKGNEIHISMIIKRPSLFGLRSSQIKEIYEKYGETFDEEGDARSDIMWMVIEEGWIRTRHYKSERFFMINIHKLDKKIKGILRLFAIDMLSHGYKGYDIQIDVGGFGEILEFPLDEVASDVLFVGDSIECDDLVRDSLSFYDSFEDFCYHEDRRIRSLRKGDLVRYK